MTPSGPAPTFAAGPVTATEAVAPPVVAPFPAPPGPPPAPDARRALLWYGATAGGVLVIGLTVVLVLLLNGQLGSGRGPLTPHAAPPEDLRPPLARLCAPPPGAPVPPAPPGPAPAGPRSSDPTAGISYRAYPQPWLPWTSHWTMGTLEVPYGEGQYFVTERYGMAGQQYLATILSAAVPAAENDSTAVDIECVGHQVAADVRASYYPQPTTMDVLRSGRTSLGGRPAWVTTFRLHFHADGLTATDELVGVALIDVGRPTAAVLYVSIPGTHRQWDHVVDEVLDSVRPL